MLCITRRRGERVRIGEDVWVEVLDIDRGQVRLGIYAPREVPIFRQELLPLNQPTEPQAFDIGGEG